MSVLSDIKTPFRNGNVLMQIIMVNVAIFLLLNVFRIFFFFSGYTHEILEYKLHEEVGNYITLPMKFEWYIYRPWTIFTYFFAQVEVFHIFFNMLVLYFFGNIIQNLLGYSRTLAIYCYSGIVGGILTLIMHSFIPVLSPYSSYLIGASGSVMGIVMAAATLVPDKKIFLFFFGEIKLIYIALVYVVIDLIGITYVDGVGHICHLGGALTGFLFMYSLKRGNDWSKPFNAVFYGITGLFKKRKRSKLKIVKNNANDAKGNTKSPSSSLTKEQVQRKIDFILDKISKGGYESLTKEEKEFLFVHGKNI